MSKENPSTEVVVLTPADELALIMGQVEMSVEDTEATINRLIMQTFEAEKVEDIFGGTGTVSSQEAVGWPLVVRDYTLHRSDFATDGHAVFMVVDAVRIDTGEVIALTTGAKRIMAQVVTAKARGVLPANVVIVEVGQAKPGQSRALMMTLLTQPERLEA